MILLGITGQKQSGKDTVLKCIRELLPHKAILQRNFADALKQEVALACGVTLDFINENKDLFRPILQWWGTEFRRNLFGEDYWIKKWLVEVHRASLKSPYLLVCTDVRFLNEAQAIRNLDGILWRVYRTSNALDTHKSETELLNIDVSGIIYNVSTLENLREKTKNLLIKHGIYTTK